MGPQVGVMTQRVISTLQHIYNIFLFLFYLPCTNQPGDVVIRLPSVVGRIYYVPQVLKLYRRK